MAGRKPTIADVAKRAGVSKGLVSFAFNDKPGVAPQTRDRILAVAAEMGWRPSLSARSLSTRTSYALGLVVKRDPRVIAADPFFPAFISGIESVLADEGRVLVLSVVVDQEAELDAYRKLVGDSRVDGFFLTDIRADDPRLGLLDELSVPAVAVGRPEGANRFPVVNLDDSAGIAEAVAHLVKLGHTRIAHVAGDTSMVHGRRRRTSFCAAMLAAGLDAEMIIDTDFSAAQGAAATDQLLKLGAPPTAIVYANDPMAIAGMGVANQLGLAVPTDLSITGFDGTEIGRHIYPALTTVHSDPMEWGRTAAQVLLEVMAEGSAKDRELPPAEFVLGASTAPPTTSGSPNRAN